MTASAAADVVSAMRARDRCADALGIDVLDAGEGYAVVSMVVRATMCNGHGICHGGMIFTLADTAFAFACNSHNVRTVAAAASVEFLQPVPEGATVRARAEERWATERSKSGVYDVTVELVDGTTVAMFRGRSLRVGGSVLVP